MKKADVGLEVLRTPNEPLDRKAVDRATNECKKLINKIINNSQQKKISDIYKNEYNKNLHRYNRTRYLSIFKSDMAPSTCVYKQINNR
jgi:hypothetical protein